MTFMAQHHTTGEAQDEPETQSSRTSALGESTPVKLGFIIGLLGLCAGGFGFWIWWAATISAKIDTMIAQQAAFARATDTHQIAIVDLQAWRKLIDTVGTPSMMIKTAEIQKQLDELQRAFELHKVTTTMMKGTP